MVDRSEKAHRWAFDWVLLWEVNVDFPLAEFVSGIRGTCIKKVLTDKVDKECGVVFASLNFLFSESKPADVLFFSLQ